MKDKKVQLKNITESALQLEGLLLQPGEVVVVDRKLAEQLRSDHPTRLEVGLEK